jgi:hypothetical protein
MGNFKPLPVARVSFAFTLKGKDARLFWFTPSMHLLALQKFGLFLNHSASTERFMPLTCQATDFQSAPIACTHRAS